MAGSISFLSLAYLVEISVVLNLAYRELKFPNLHEKLLEEVNKVKALAKIHEVPEDNEELRMINALANQDGKCLWLKSNNFALTSKFSKFHEEFLKEAKAAMDEKDEEKYQEIVKNLSQKTGSSSIHKFIEKTRLKFLEQFFFSAVKPGVVITIVNWFIVYNVLLLLLFTFFSNIAIDFAELVTSDLFELFVIGIVITFLILVTAFLQINSFVSIICQLLGFIVLAIIFDISGVYITNFSSGEWWGVAFGTLSMFTILPLLFLSWSASCYEFLFGKGPAPGIIELLRIAMLKNAEIKSITAEQKTAVDYKNR